MALRKDCPKCAASMTAGFVLDADQNGGKKVSRWIEGAPDKRWYGLKVRGKPQFDIESYRCNRCGYLENYAPG